MNEEDYKAIVEPLLAAATSRVKVVVDHLTMQPPLAVALRATKALVWWALLQGAHHHEAVLELERRSRLPKTRGITHK